MIVQQKRHIAKTISYRLISSLSGFLILWAATGSTKVSAAFLASELLYKPIIYFLHERIWYKYTKFGLKEEVKKRNNSL